MTGFPSVRDRAIATQAKHGDILKRLTPEVIASDDALKIVRDDINFLEHDYIWAELSALGVDIPANLSSVDPEHAIVLAVRADLRDSVSRIELMLKVRSDERRFAKLPQSFGEALAQGLGASVEGARAAAAAGAAAVRSLLDNPLVIVGIVVGVISIFITLLMLFKD